MTAFPLLILIKGLGQTGELIAVTGFEDGSAAQLLVVEILERDGRRVRETVNELQRFFLCHDGTDLYLGALQRSV